MSEETLKNHIDNEYRTEKTVPLNKKENHSTEPLTADNPTEPAPVNQGNSLLVGELSIKTQQNDVVAEKILQPQQREEKGTRPIVPPLCFSSSGLCPSHVSAIWLHYHRIPHAVFLCRAAINVDATDKFVLVVPLSTDQKLLRELRLVLRNLRKAGCFKKIEDRKFRDEDLDGNLCCTLAAFIANAEMIRKSGFRVVVLTNVHGVVDELSSTLYLKTLFYSLSNPGEKSEILLPFDTLRGYFSRIRCVFVVDCCRTKLHVDPANKLFWPVRNSTYQIEEFHSIVYSTQHGERAYIDSFLATFCETALTTPFYALLRAVPIRMKQAKVEQQPEFINWPCTVNLLFGVATQKKEPLTGRRKKVTRPRQATLSEEANSC